MITAHFIYNKIIFERLFQRDMYPGRYPVIDHCPKCTKLRIVRETKCKINQFTAITKRYFIFITVFLYIDISLHIGSGIPVFKTGKCIQINRSCFQLIYRVVRITKINAPGGKYESVFIPASQFHFFITPIANIQWYGDQDTAKQQYFADRHPKNQIEKDDKTQRINS